MKIRTQDAERYLDYTEIYAGSYGNGGRAAVYVMSRFHREPVCVGVYESMDRAKGILFEISQAYQARKRVFYAPAE